MNAVVVYKSKSGYTKGYAQWIAEALGCQAKEHGSVDVGELKKYDTIVYGGGLYAGGIAGVKLITKNYETLKDKKIVIWATGSGPSDSDELEGMWKKNLTEDQLAHIKTFYLRGGFDYQKLGIIDKLLMKVFKSMLEKEKEPKPGTEGFLKAFYEPQDYRSKDNIEELVNAATS